MSLGEGLWLLWALAGHVGLVFWIMSQLHATPMPKGRMRWLSAIVAIVGFIIPAAILWRVSIVGFTSWTALWQRGVLDAAMVTYLATCCLLTAGPVTRWVVRGLFRRPPRALVKSGAELIDLKDRLGGHTVRGASQRALARLPGNQTFELEVSEKHLELHRMPAELTGLSIAHLSDLHYSGRLERPYFDEIIDQTNRLNADLIAVTGDLVDKPHCIDWLAATLGRLRAPLGVYFILGNHDLRVDAVEVRRCLTEAGLIDVGGRWLQLEHQGVKIIVAGNELPWIRPAADLRDAPIRPGFGGPTRLLLAHTPDQFRWARRHDFDLMLAGHNHGGQMNLPMLGPVIAPSRHGVKYAGGTFYKRPTVMHVSRGVSALMPVRFNCRPEVTRLVLHPATTGRRQRRPREAVHSPRA